MRYGLTDTQWRRARDEMRDVLVACARDRRTITYGELARRIEAVRLQPRHRRFSVLLNEVCESEDAEGRPMLGSLVVKQDTGRPGAGYFRVARGLARDVEAEESFWESELEHVFAFWDARGGRPSREDVP